jgi:hypothetical protein
VVDRGGAKGSTEEWIMREGIIIIIIKSPTEGLLKKYLKGPAAILHRLA